MASEGVVSQPAQQALPEAPPMRTVNLRALTLGAEALLSFVLYDYLALRHEDHILLGIETELHCFTSKFTVNSAHQRRPRSQPHRLGRLIGVER